MNVVCTWQRSPWGPALSLFLRDWGIPEQLSLHTWTCNLYHLELPRWCCGKESACQCRRHKFDPWVRKIPWGGNDHPLQYSRLENSMEGGTWQATARGSTKSQAWAQHYLFHLNSTLCCSSAESEVAQLCPTLCDPMDCSLPGSSVPGILQARILEWVAISFSRGSPWPKDRTRVSCITGRRLTVWATGEVLRASVIARLVDSLPAVQETLILFVRREDLPEWG